MCPQAVLHIGTEKTGSTALQRTLQRNKKALLAQNLCYPTDAVAHHTLVNIVVAPRRASAIVSPEERDRYLLDLREEAEVLPPDATVILSSELCHSRLDTQEAKKLLHLLAEIGLPVRRIVVYFRDQCSLLESSYSEGVKGGLQWSHPLEQLRSRSYYSHKLMAERWLAAAHQCSPKAELAIYSYNAHRHRLAAHFLEQAGFDATDLVDVDIEANARGSIALIEAVKRAKALDPTLPSHPFYRWLQPVDARPVRPFLDAQAREAIDREFAGQNRAMCADFGLDPDQFPASPPVDDIDERPFVLDDVLHMMIALFRRETDTTP